ncbi:hypothetical protein HAX54_037536 [Datura stramonium]|uniref:Uncharacterized protein n=1 Tax=Datura stramonium TaxID=4076 RepID=A0ABS8VJN0_DATST|nr:hypothetical protein [Datura stramonium]
MDSATITQKITRFITVAERGEHYEQIAKADRVRRCDNQKESFSQRTATTKQHQLESSFVEAIRRNKWTTEATKRSAIQTTNSRINIPGGSLVSDDDVLGILGKFLAPNQEIPTLSDIRRREGSRLPAGISSQHHQEGTGGLAVELILTSEEAEQQCNTPISTIHPVEVSEEAPLMIEDVEPVDILSPDYGMDITLGMFKDISKICRQRGQLSCL